VGAYSAELYEAWAARHAVPQREVRNTRDILRTAAILHDVGKVAVSDAILRKASELSYDEKLQLRHHTILGARLFKRSSSPWDKMAAEVALNHHENWDGSGYPGKIDDIYAQKVYLGPGRQATEIPLPARIVALADVYDALTSRRPYKEPYPHEVAREMIVKDSGKHFDPACVQAFLNRQKDFLHIKDQSVEGTPFSIDLRSSHFQFSRRDEPLRGKVWAAGPMDGEEKPESKLEEAKPVESKPEEAKPVEPKSEEPKPVESKREPPEPEDPPKTVAGDEGRIE
jgi:hypothetical protein